MGTKGLGMPWNKNECKGMNKQGLRMQRNAKEWVRKALEWVGMSWNALE